MRRSQVLDVTQPMANQKWAPSGSVHRFYRKFGRGVHVRCPRRRRCSVARWVQMAALRAAICNALSGWVEAQGRYPSPMGLDNHRQATGRDSDECPETITHVIWYTYRKILLSSSHSNSILSILNYLTVSVICIVIPWFLWNIVIKFPEVL